MNTLRIYISDKRALAYYQEKATAEFWDRHWSTTDLQNVLRSSKDDGLFIPLVKKYLPKDSVVLEGGCGMGHIVHALQYQRFKAIGVDFAVQTIKKIKEAVPELDVRIGDVRRIDLADASLDGYVSAGVIEHFWEGYEAILNEMQRTLKIGGILFISFPYLSPLRQLKILLRLYPFARKGNMDAQVNNFYQYALSSSKVQADIEALGFQMLQFIKNDGIKGFKDEVTFLKPILQKVYDGKRCQSLRYIFDLILRPFAAHCAVLVLRKIK